MFTKYLLIPNYTGPNPSLQSQNKKLPTLKANHGIFMSRFIKAAL